MEKMLENDVTHRGLISKIYKQLIQLSKSKNKLANWKIYKDHNKHYPKKAYRWPVGKWKVAQHH